MTEETSRNPRTGRRHFRFGFSTLLGAGLLALVTACGQTPEATETVDETPEAEVQADDVREEFAEAASTLREYSYEQREDFEEWTVEQLAVLDSRLDEIEARTAELGDQASEEWSETVQDLKDRRADLDAKLDQTLAASKESWQELQTGFSKAREDLSTAVDNAIDTLEGDESPEAQDEESGEGSQS